jgi:hypothetical protein
MGSLLRLKQKYTKGAGVKQKELGIINGGFFSSMGGH